MADAATLDRTSLAAARRRARLPRRAVIATSVVLALLGVKGLIRGVPVPVVRTAPAAVPPVRTAAAGFAQAFARSYLTWDPLHPELHAAALKPFLGPDVDVDAGLPVPSAGAQRVTWTAVVDQADTDPGRVAVTVAVAVDAQSALRYLAVPVSYTAAGGLAVSDYPALVGRPAPDRTLAGRSGDDVDDPRLSAVVRRALGNYVSGATDNLRADATPGSHLVPPAPALSLEDVLSLQWAGRARGRVSAVLVARDGRDVAYTLRYELAVVKRDRWYVAEINPPMTRKESP